MAQDPTIERSTLIEVMAWCRQATGHYLKQYLTTFISPYGVTHNELWFIWWMPMSLTIRPGLVPVSAAVHQRDRAHQTGTHMALRRRLWLGTCTYEIVKYAYIIIYMRRLNNWKTDRHITYMYMYSLSSLSPFLSLYICIDETCV